MMDDKKTSKQKKDYKKPMVSRFQLRAEEAVLGFCKSSGSSGPGPSNCMDMLNAACMFHGS